MCAHPATRHPAQKPRKCTRYRFRRAYVNAVVLVEASRGMGRDCWRGQASIITNSSIVRCCFPNQLFLEMILTTLKPCVLNCRSVCVTPPYPASSNHKAWPSRFQPPRGVSGFNAAPPRPRIDFSAQVAQSFLAMQSVMGMYGVSYTCTGSPTSCGCTKTWTAYRCLVFLAPRGAADRACTQYAALVTKFLGEKDHT